MASQQQLIGVHQTFAAIAWNSIRQMREAHAVLQRARLPEFPAGEVGDEFWDRMNEVNTWLSPWADRVQHNALTAIVFAALTLEAFINYYGKKNKLFLPENEGQRRKWEVATRGALPTRVYDQVEQLARTRNSLAHYKPKSIAFQRVDVEDPTIAGTLSLLHQYLEELMRSMARSKVATHEVESKAEMAGVLLENVGEALAEMDSTISRDEFVVVSEVLPPPTPPWEN